MEIAGGTYEGRSKTRIAARAAWTTVLYLGGGLALSFVLAIAVSNVPIHMNELLKNTGAVLVLLAFLAFASLRWGRAMAAIAGLPDGNRAAKFGGLSFVIALFVAGLVVSPGEALFEIGIPIHVLYALLFVPAAFLIVAAVAMTWGRVLKGWRLAGQLALRAATPAGLAFLLAYLVIDAVGHRVGAPGAAERATMITVTFVGCLAAAAAGGAGLGAGLLRFSKED